MTETTVSIEGHTKTGAPFISVPKKDVILDATVLSTLMSCPRLTDFKFNHNLQSIKGKSNSLEVGNIVHKGLEIAYSSMIKGVKKSDAVGFGIMAAQLYATGCPHCTDYTGEAKPSCGHQVNEYPGVRNTPLTNEGHYVGINWAIQTLEQYFEHYKNDSWVSLEVETVKGKILYEDDEIRVLWKAKLDWLVDTNSGILPVDHKTQKQKRPKIKLNNQFIGQCLVMNTRNMIINNIGFQTTLKPQEKFTREMISYSGDALIEWQSQILPYYAYKLIDHTEQNHWPPDFTHCENKYGNCTFIEVCSSDRNMREEVIRADFVKGPSWNPRNEPVE